MLISKFENVVFNVFHFVDSRPGGKDASSQIQTRHMVVIPLREASISVSDEMAFLV